MTKANRELLKTHKAVRLQRVGNDAWWNVTGERLKQERCVCTHAMCGEVTAIKKAIRQDIDEQNAAWVKGTPNNIPNCVPSQSFTTGE